MSITWRGMRLQLFQRIKSFFGKKVPIRFIFLVGLIALTPFVVQYLTLRNRILGRTQLDNEGLGIQELVRRVQAEVEQSEDSRIRSGIAPLFELNDFDLEINFVVKTRTTAQGELEYHFVTVNSESEVSSEKTQKITLRMKATTPQFEPQMISSPIQDAKPEDIITYNPTASNVVASQKSASKKRDTSKAQSRNGLLKDMLYFERERVNIPCEVKLSKTHSDYIEISVDARSLPIFAKLANVSASISFYDANNKPIAEKIQFNFTDAEVPILRGGKIHTRLFKHTYSLAHSVKGEFIAYILVGRRSPM
jgi:hypothetical protein